MKKFTLLLCILFMLSLLGCSAKDAETPTYEPVCADGPAEKATESTQPEETEPPTMQMVDKEPAVSTLDTPYYTLTIPQDWAFDCLYDIIELEKDAYNLILYEKQDYETRKGGNLFSILLLRPEQDVTIFPNYEVIGTLQSPDWIFNVVVLYPTDVQFTDDTAQVYNRLCEQIPSVLESFSAKDSCGFTAGETAKPRNEIVTPYYTLSLPEDWVNACNSEIIERENGAYNLIVREALSFQEFGGGKLFSILLLPTDADYTQYPSYEYLGTLQSPSGEFHVVVLYPTDVQYSEDSAQIYNRLCEQIPSVLESFSANDSCSFTAGEITKTNNQIITPYYSLTLPDHWVDACTSEIIERENGAYNLIVRELSSFQEFGGGKLFSILLLPTDVEYTEYPRYDYLGTLESPDWEFNVVVLYPTDAQFIPNTADAYLKLSDTISSVTHTLEPLDGSCYFYPAN